MERAVKLALHLFVLSTALSARLAFAEPDRLPLPAHHEPRDADLDRDMTPHSLPPWVTCLLFGSLTTLVMSIWRGMSSTTAKKS